MVSPHLDDAALSAHWLMTELDDVVVVSVCTSAPDGTVNDWDRELGFSSGAVAAAVRTVEDEQALALTNVRSVQLGLEAVEYRTVDGQAAFEERLITGVAKVLADHPGAVLVLPGAFGAPSNRIRQRRTRIAVPVLRAAPGAKQHPDHRITRDVLLAAHAGSVPIAFYADLPYARVGGRTQLRAAAAAVGLDLRPVSVPVDLAAKDRVLRCYASQYRTFLPAWGSRIEHGFQPYERLWWSTPAVREG